jgi:hypothetical protein
MYHGDFHPLMNFDPHCKISSMSLYFIDMVPFIWTMLSISSIMHSTYYITNCIYACSISFIMKLHVEIAIYGKYNSFELELMKTILSLMWLHFI